MLLWQAIESVVCKLAGAEGAESKGPVLAALLCKFCLTVYLS